MSVLALSLVGCSDHLLTTIVEEPEAPEPVYQTDEFVQDDPDKVDVAFIVDDSGSMSSHQDELSYNMPMFSEYLFESGLDYHAGVITTDMDDESKTGQLQAQMGYYYDTDGTWQEYEIPYLSWDTQDTIDNLGLVDENGYAMEVEDLFYDMAMVGTSGSASEKGLDAFYYSLNYYQDPGEANEGYFRTEAALHAIFVSDEDDFSTEITPDEFFEEMLETMETRDVYIHSIVGQEDDTCNASEGKSYIELSTLFEGQNLSICESNWGNMMEELSLQVSGLSREFYLSKEPILETLEVEVLYEDPEGSGEYSSYYPRIGDESFDELEYREETNSIYFKRIEDMPDPGDEVNITYQVDWYYLSQHRDDIEQ